MCAMSVAYYQLLDATIQHLSELKARGVRFVPVSPETLAGLRTTGPRTQGPLTTGLQSTVPLPTRPAAARPQTSEPGRPPTASIRALGKPVGPKPIAQATLLPAPGQEAVAAPTPDLGPEAKSVAFPELRELSMHCWKLPPLAPTHITLVSRLRHIKPTPTYVSAYT